MPPGCKSSREPDDDAVRKLGELIMEPYPVRTALAGYVFMSDVPGGHRPSGDDLPDAAEGRQALAGVLPRSQQGRDRCRFLGAALQEAAEKGIIGAEDVQPLTDYDARRYDCLLTDQFAEL